ncbi:MAG: ankyrin repeat domain-containing protein [Deltaproteobacteria bacterium]|nr:ankyrin repeat domain-containing protein [Deltaproteobacteria bacterium]
MKDLADKGSELDKPDAFRKTPLLYAIYNGHSEIVTYLADKVNVNQEITKGETPLKVAESLMFTDIVDILKINGAR